MALKEPLPFPEWRNKDGRLSAAPGSTGIPAQNLVPLDSTKFPILLGTFRLDLGEVGLSLSLIFPIEAPVNMQAGDCCKALEARFDLPH